MKLLQQIQLTPTNKIKPVYRDLQSRAFSNEIPRLEKLPTVKAYEASIKFGCEIDIPEETAFNMSHYENEARKLISRFLFNEVLEVLQTYLNEGAKDITLLTELETKILAGAM